MEKLLSNLESLIRLSIKDPYIERALKIVVDHQSLENVEKPSGRLTTDRPDGIFLWHMLKEKPDLKDKFLDAAEAVVVRQGIGNLTLDAVAAEAGMSKGGLLHHFPAKDLLIEAMVKRSAENWRNCYMTAYHLTPEGPGRMSRALLSHCLSEGWTEQLRQSSSAVFAALAQNPSLIQSIREAYSDLHQMVLKDDLPSGVGETVAAAIDGLWLYWVLGLITVDKHLIGRVRLAIESMLGCSSPVHKSSKRKSKVHIKKRSGGH